ncbi:effector-associated domain 2-containing protein [Streptomyces zhihengii]|uniref:Uncharacterized protein n=1 Tax=Streptomyces zhihengii TaxID=1818004 RepID=A0ABS2V326_9ACTN|nr:hypothetical protein [Streptomyces zhihengii]MBM9624074.1 hypothetical protein [Streptomyces zhihengii]
MDFNSAPRVLSAGGHVLSELVDALCDLPGFADAPTRAVILRDLRPPLVDVLNWEASTRSMAGQVVQQFRHRDGALLELVQVLAYFHGETPAIARMRLLVTRLTKPVDPVTPRGAELVRILTDGLQPWLPSFLEVAGSAAERAPRSPGEAVAFLEDLAAPPHQPPPVLRFAVALAGCPGWSRPQLEELQEWIQRLARRLGVSIPVEAGAPYSHGPSAGPGNDVRLVVSLQRYQPGSRECLLSMWLGYSRDRWIVLVVEDEPQSLERIVARFNLYFERAQELSGSLPSRVEFMLPRSLLGLPVDRWSVKSPDSDQPAAGLPLGVLCPVVVRDLERPADSRARERWSRRWQEYKSSRSLPVERTAWLPTGRDHDLPSRTRELSHALAVVVEPPPRQTYAPAGEVTRAVGMALDAGVPVVLWGRDEGDADGHAESGALHAVTRRLMSGGSPTRLPDRITSLRREALDSGAPSPAEQLALVWDDPGGRPDVGGGALRCP